jgi:hypothetical protein
MAQNRLPHTFEPQIDRKRRLESARYRPGLPPFVVGVHNEDRSAPLCATASTTCRSPRARDRASRRSCIRGDAAGALSLLRSMSVPSLTTPRRRTMGTAGLEPATSRVSDSASPADSDRSPHASAGTKRRTTRLLLRTSVAANLAAKRLLIAGFYDGRGWFRTSVLSRVKHGVRCLFRPRNACKSSQRAMPTDAPGWA